LYKFRKFLAVSVDRYHRGSGGRSLSRRRSNAGLGAAPGTWRFYIFL